MEEGKKEKTHTKVRRDYRSWLKWIVLAVLIGIVILLIFLMRGKTTTTGNYPENVSDASLECEISGMKYPVFTYDQSNKKSTKVVMLFSHDELKSISLTHSLYYRDKNLISGSEAHNHAAMNKSFAADGLKVADAYNAKYARMEDRMTMTLYETENNLDQVAKKYFLIKNGDLKTLSDYRGNYESQGFTCREISE